MVDQVYRDLCQTMAKRGGRYPGHDIPEFYELAQELFTPEEAAISNAMPRGFFTPAQLAEVMGLSEEQALQKLEALADRYLCNAGEMGGAKFFGGPPFVPGIFEYQFMAGTKTDRDRHLARLIHNYKTALDAIQGPQKVTFPTTRVISVDRLVQAGNEIHTYDQVSSYIEKYDPIAVSTCFCRHEAELLDEKNVCGKPNEVCMTFNVGAQFLISRGIGRQVTKAEAYEILKKTEEAGLVHCSINRQEIDFLCNCCSCHCMILKTALAQPKPGQILFSSFMPSWDAELCASCETCIGRCPGTALTMGENDLPVVNMDRCFGCGACATGCPSEAIGMVARPQAPVPPVDQKALKEALKTSRP